MVIEVCRSSALPAAAELESGLLDSLVAKLNELRRTAALEYALRVGRLIVDVMYNGDLSRWRLQGEHEVSFRQLAARSAVDLKMSATTLYRAVALYDLCSRLSVELWRDFSATHLRAVLGLPEPDQVRLLSLAKVQDWNAQELYEKAAATRGRVLTRRRPSSPPPSMELLRRVLSLLKEPDDFLGSLDPTAALHWVNEMREAIDRFEPVLVSALPGAERRPDGPVDQEGRSDAPAGPPGEAPPGEDDDDG